MKFLTIKDCLDSFNDEHSFTEAVQDTINAYREGKEDLEAFLDEHLWAVNDTEFTNDADKQYYMTLGKIEEVLVHSNLIYND